LEQYVAGVRAQGHLVAGQLAAGSTQLFLTPGVIFRSVSLMDWLKLAVGRAISSP
jgi:hypothetical protein